jgi:uncharacterized protein (DUF1501 family)
MVLGLGAASLYKEWDLKPRTGMRDVLKGLPKDHLRLGDAALASRVFPDCKIARPTPGLVVTA